MNFVRAYSPRVHEGKVGSNKAWKSPFREETHYLISTNISFMYKNIFFLFIGVLLANLSLSAQKTETVPLKFIIKSHQVKDGQLVCDIAYKSIKDDSFKGRGTLLMTRAQFNALWTKRPSSIKGLVGYGVVTSMLAELSQSLDAERIQGKLGIVRMNTRHATKNEKAIWVDFSPEV